MTTKELNRDIKKLSSEIYRMSFEDMDKYFEYIEKTAKPEFMRLYDADREMVYMNIDSVKTLLRLNISHRFIPLHQFGNQIKINNQ